MSETNSWLHRLTRLGLFLTMGAMMNASSATSMNWKEEVLLHDENKLTVERSQNLGSYPAIESREREAIDETLSFTNPYTKQVVTWKTSFQDNVPDQNGLNLLVLDIVNSIPYIATYPAGCIAYNKWKRPNPPYVFFKYENNAWQRISLTAFPAQLSRTNVIVGGPSQETRKPFYTAAAIRAENQDLQPEYKTILREPFPTAAGGCPELVRIEGGWASPGGAKSPIPIIPPHPVNKK
ncbi:MAG TPA: hypothetical protein VF501_00635 [Thiobacillus sp.]